MSTAPVANCACTRESRCEEASSAVLCECGCGQETRIAPCTDRSKGWIKGEPLRFVLGHRWLGVKPPNADRPIEYSVVDLGYASPCWIWRGSVSHNGYGLIFRDGRSYRAHRFVYEKTHGPIPDGLEPDHLCRQRICINPDHLEPVSRAVNARRGAAAKLTQAKADEIRRMYEAGSYSLRQLGRMFGVHNSQICRIVNREAWVPGPNEKETV